MAIRCDCHWIPVALHPDLQTVLLRAEDTPGCPAHDGARLERPAA